MINRVIELARYCSTLERLQNILASIEELYPMPLPSEFDFYDYEGGLSSEQDTADIVLFHFLSQLLQEQHLLTDPEDNLMDFTEEEQRAHRDMIDFLIGNNYYQQLLRKFILVHFAQSGYIDREYCLANAAQFGFSLEDPTRRDRVYDWVRLRIEVAKSDIRDDDNAERLLGELVQVERDPALL
jgi:hypothetical protein